MRWLSPKVLFDVVRQFLGKIGGVLDVLRIWRRPKILVAVIGGILLLGTLAVVVLPKPDKVPTAGVKVTKAKVKKVKKSKTAAQKKAEAAAERKLRAELLADTKRILAAAARKAQTAKERQRQAKLERKLKWIALGNGRLWKITRFGYEGKPRKKKKEATGKPKLPGEDLFASNAFPLGADEDDGTYTFGVDPEDQILPGKDWRKHIWTKKDTGKKKTKKKKKKAKRKPVIVPASYIYATIDSSEKVFLTLPPTVERVFRHSRSLLIDKDYGTEAIDAWAKARPVEDFVSLTAIVRGNLFGAIERVGVRYRMSSAFLDRLKPWAVASMFNLEPAEYLRLRAGRHVLPEILQIRASARGMPVVPLETIEQSLDLVSNFTDPEQVSLLAKAVRINRGIEVYRTDLKKAYLAGETAKMIKMYRKRLTGYGPVLAEKIGLRSVEGRSRRMAGNMIAHLNRGKAFIAMPAINMPGPNGVLRILTRNGYRVRYVETDATKPILSANPRYVNSPFFGDTLDPKPRKKATPQIATKKAKHKANPKAMSKPKAKRKPMKKRKAASSPE